jgi:hypothetical protein
MLKMFVTRAAKAAWESAGTVPETTYDLENVGEVVADEEIVEVRITPQDLGIELPYYPGEGTQCGAECRCSWEIDVHDSPQHGGMGIFATWLTTEDGEPCPDCQERAQAWQNEFICLKADEA